MGQVYPDLLLWSAPNQRRMVAQAWLELLFLQYLTLVWHQRTSTRVQASRAKRLRLAIVRFGSEADFQAMPNLRFPDSLAGTYTAF